MDRDFVKRVVALSAAGVLPVTVACALAGGLSAAAGALAGGAVSLGSFLWLVQGAAGAGAALAGRVGPLWVLGVLLRWVAVFGAVAALVWAGASPLALAAGASVLPLVILARGLRVARLAP
jgi:hypothetical protein